MKKKILFSFCESSYIRNYINTSVLDLLNKDYELYFIADKRIAADQKEKIEQLRNFKGFFYYETSKILKFNKLNIRGSYINEKNSSSFKMNNRGIYIQNRLYWDRENPLKTLFSFPKRFTKKIFNLLEYYYYKNFGNEEEITEKFKNKNKLNSFVKKIINEINPDLIIYPANGNKIINFEIVIIAKENNIKTFKICDNWDNPSSRNFIKPKADFIGVWGLQSFNHARDVNNFKPENIFIMGSARFDNYVTNKSKDISMFDFKYILLLENFINHKIEQTLEKLDKIISTNKKFHNTKIIYRPHPNGKDFNFINVKKFKNVILDPQVESAYNILNRKTSPNLDYYPSLLNNAEMIIAAPTTMIIEAMMFYKKTIVLGYSGYNFFNFKNFIKYNIHLHDLEKFPILRINKDLNNLEKQMEDLSQIKVNSKTFDEIDNHRNYYLADKKKYNKVLLESVNKILS